MRFLVTWGGHSTKRSSSLHYLSRCDSDQAMTVVLIWFGYLKCIEIDAANRIHFGVAVMIQWKTEMSSSTVMENAACPLAQPNFLLKLRRRIYYYCSCCVDYYGLRMSS